MNQDIWTNDVLDYIQHRGMGREIAGPFEIEVSVAFLLRGGPAAKPAIEFIVTAAEVFHLCGTERREGKEESVPLIAVDLLSRKYPGHLKQLESGQDHALSSVIRTFQLSELANCVIAKTLKFGRQISSQSSQPVGTFHHLKSITQHRHLLFPGRRLSRRRAADSHAVIQASDPGQNLRQHGYTTRVIDSHLEFPVFAGDQILGEPGLFNTSEHAFAQSDRAYGHAIQAVGPKPVAIVCPPCFTSSCGEHPIPI